MLADPLNGTIHMRTTGNTWKTPHPAEATYAVSGRVGVRVAI
jgi:hypothetical protein